MELQRRNKNQQDLHPLADVFQPCGADETRKGGEGK